MNDRDEDLGVLVQLDDGRPALRYARHYPHPPEKVWRALIEPSSLAAWFPARIDGERAPGATLRFVFEGDEGPVLEGKIHAFEPPRLLAYTWGEELLRFELAAAGPHGQHCALVFTTTFGERSSAPRDATGWHMCLRALAAALREEPAADASEPFPALYQQYVARLALGAFPGFLTGAPADEIAALLPAAGLDGQVLRSAAGTRVGFLHAERDVSVAAHALARDAYLYVIEGCYVLSLGGNELTLSSGMELHVPGGGTVKGQIRAGTRFIYGLAAVQQQG
jgi:uncharacterized protein YndB with AHSA1/START domain